MCIRDSFCQVDCLGCYQFPVLILHNENHIDHPDYSFFFEFQQLRGGLATELVSRKPDHQVLHRTHYSLNWMAQTFSNRRRPAELLFGNDAAITSISPCENHSRVFFENSLNAARASSVRSTASDVTSFPFSSFTMKTISITRIIPFFSSFSSSGAALPLNLFPGNLIIR